MPRAPSPTRHGDGNVSAGSGIGPQQQPGCEAAEQRKGEVARSLGMNKEEIASAFRHVAETLRDSGAMRSLMELQREFDQLQRQREQEPVETGRARGREDGKGKEEPKGKGKRVGLPSRTEAVGASTSGSYGGEGPLARTDAVGAPTSGSHGGARNEGGKRGRQSTVPEVLRTVWPQGPQEVRVL